MFKSSFMFEKKNQGKGNTRTEFDSTYFFCKCGAPSWFCSPRVQASKPYIPSLIVGAKRKYDYEQFMFGLQSEPVYHGTEKIFASSRTICEQTMNDCSLNRVRGSFFHLFREELLAFTVCAFALLPPEKKSRTALITNIYV